MFLGLFTPITTRVIFFYLLVFFYNKHVLSKGNYTNNDKDLIANI
jgi:hypothetical protein